MTCIVLIKRANRENRTFAFSGIQNDPTHNNVVKQKTKMYTKKIIAFFGNSKHFLQSLAIRYQLFEHSLHKILVIKNLTIQVSK